MYDYIIVGAGSAGCVLANRLSADSSKRVCLIEAGPRDESALIHMPLGIALLANSKTLNWRFDTESQKELGNRKLFWPRGKTLGGSSSINGMIYIRGHKADYDQWEAAGGEKWGWKNALSIFKEHEGNERMGDTELHGGSGPLPVSDLRTVNPLSQAFVRAGTELQNPLNEDFNGASQEGVGMYQVTQKNGQRWSSARAFLVPALERSNLDVLTDTRVNRVIFDDKRASGVDVSPKNEDAHQVKLNIGGEVILSGGAVNSPQLLMLSGIGAKEELEAQGIPVLHDLPEVGKNLADHLDITVMGEANSRLPIGVAFSSIPRSIAAIFKYIFSKKGFLTSNAVESGGFVKSDPSLDRPNLQYHFLPAYLADHGRKIKTGYGITLHICDLIPKSRGYIGLKSSDPAADPLIQPNYLSHPDDVATLLAGLKLGRAIFQAPAMAKHISKEIHPGENVNTDEELIADIRKRAETIYHPVGSCRMGSDENSVVDPELRVRGVEGLRVIDASIMPVLVAGNTNAPTMMIGENGARMILAEKQ